MPDDRPTLDYGRPEPRVRPRWVDLLLVVLAAFAVLIVLAVPMLVVFIFFPNAEKYLDPAYMWFTIFGVAFGFWGFRRFSSWRNRRF